MPKYDPKKIEPKWQKFWADQKTFEVVEDFKHPEKKFYSLIEFPYPSGEGLHVGHPRPYTAMDVVSRKRRMQGYNVLYPIGFDAFGLPTENFAIKTGQPPAEVTKKNIANFTRQIKSLGYSFAWDRQVDTSDPKYYKWTQWIFLQLFKHGLAYKKSTTINWCPKDKIGLANEEAAGGVCDRCGGPVEKREKEQWMLAITKYADKLLDGLKNVDYIVPARVQQENWIGRSEGAEIVFSLNVPGQEPGKHKVSAFTTRPDTIFGATFLAISAELADKWLQVGWQAPPEVKKYVSETLAEQKKTVARDVELEKTGINSLVTALNPFNNEEIPVWVTNYVLPGYGTGAIMAVPAHDERDFEFAKKYNLPIRQVVAPYIKLSGLNGSCIPREDKPTSKKNVVTAIIKHVPTDKYLVLKWPQGSCGFVGGGIDGEESTTEAVKREIIEETGYTDFTIKKEVISSLYSHGFKARKDTNCYDHDTVFYVEINSDAKQPLHEQDKGAHEIHLVDGPEVPKHVNWEHYLFMWDWFQKNTSCYSGDGFSVNSDFLNGLSTTEAKVKTIQWLEEKGLGKRQVNYKLRDWVFSRQRYWGEPVPLVDCKKCGWVPLPESELPLLLPVVDKYQPTDIGESPLAVMHDWVNTTCPQCGGPAKRETDIMPNWAGSSWYFLRYCDPDNDKELASAEALKYWMNIDWYNGGMEHTVLHLLYSRFWNQFLFDIGVVPTSEPYKKRTSHGMILGPDGEKMSKSRGNVINPDEMVDKFGADAFRTYIMFMGPFDQAVMWDTNGLVGVRRFLDKVWNLQEKVVKDNSKQTTDNSKFVSLMHRTIKKVSDDIEVMSFNTAIAKLMELVNEMTKQGSLLLTDYCLLIKLLSPFAPHLAEELWGVFGDGTSLSFSAWPVFDAALAKETTVTIAVQVNGKVRDQIEIAADTSEEEVKKLVMNSEKVQKWLEGKEPKKVIYIKGKLVSVVV